MSRRYKVTDYGLQSNRMDGVWWAALDRWDILFGRLGVCIIGGKLGCCEMSAVVRCHLYRRTIAPCPTRAGALRMAREWLKELEAEHDH